MKSLWHFLLVVLLVNDSHQRYIDRWSKTTDPILIEESLREVVSHLNSNHDNAYSISEASNIVCKTRFLNGIHIQLCFTLEQYRWKCFLYKSVVKTLRVQYDNCTRLLDDEPCDQIEQEEIEKTDQKAAETNNENHIEGGKIMNDERNRHVLEKETNKEQVDTNNNNQETPNEREKNMKVPEENLDKDRVDDDDKKPDDEEINKNLNNDDKNVQDANQHEQQIQNTNIGKTELNGNENLSNKDQNENVQVDNHHDHDNEREEQQQPPENTVNRAVPDTMENDDKNLFNKGLDRDNVDVYHDNYQ